MNILNPKCRINNKDFVELRKTGILNRGNQLKSIMTDMDENVNYCKIENLTNDGQGINPKDINEYISEL